MMLNMSAVFLISDKRKGSGDHAVPSDPFIGFSDQRISMPVLTKRNMRTAPS